MKVVNWLDLKLGENELHSLLMDSTVVVAARKLRQQLVRCILDQYPWQGREDLVEVYYPSGRYRQGEWLAWIRKDDQELRPLSWDLHPVEQVEEVQNPIQGRFQIVTIKVRGKERRFVAGAAAAPSEGFDYSGLTPEELDVLAVQFANVYANSLQATLKTLARSGRLPGRFVGETCVRNDLPVIAEVELAGYFDRLTLSNPWLNTQDMLAVLQGRAEWKDLPANVLLPLLRATLESSSYHSLGIDRWTTEEIYVRINREVPRGLPVPHIRSKLDIWTEADEQDLGGRNGSSVPVDFIDEFENKEESSDYLPLPVEWEPPVHPIRLRTFSYLHLTQAYFPIGDIPNAFHPQVQLVMVQVINDQSTPFLVDRHLEALKALDMERFRVTCLESGIPAGTHLWLEYLGGDRYRVAPRPLSEPRIVPCKLAYIDRGKLCIEQVEIPMEYEGDPAVFKADLRFNDIEALFAEAQASQLSVRDAIIQSIQELCAVDPHGSAYYRDIFNAVFLKRMCSPNSVMVLLYTSPCFVKVGDGRFQYRAAPPVSLSTPVVKQYKTSKRKQRPSKKVVKPEIRGTAEPRFDIVGKPRKGRRRKVGTGSGIDKPGLPQIIEPAIEAEQETPIERAPELMPDGELQEGIPAVILVVSEPVEESVQALESILQAELKPPIIVEQPIERVPSIDTTVVPEPADNPEMIAGEATEEIGQSIEAAPDETVGQTVIVEVESQPPLESEGHTIGPLPISRSIPEAEPLAGEVKDRSISLKQADGKSQKSRRPSWPGLILLFLGHSVNIFLRFLWRRHGRRG
jgi:hypothetical protein